MGPSEKASVPHNVHHQGERKSGPTDDEDGDDDADDDILAAAAAFRRQPHFRFRKRESYELEVW